MIYNETVEKIHLYACKKILGVSARTPNMLVYKELNRYPLQIDTKTRVLKYWNKILELEDSRIPKQAYRRDLKDINKERGWAGEIKKDIEKNGYGYIWLNQGTNNMKGWIKSYKQRIIDCFWQKLNSEIE